MIEQWIQRHFTHDELGHTDYKEVFWRYNLYKGTHFNVYLHRIDAPIEPPECHSHPWWFVTLILRRGYLEHNSGKRHRRRVGYIGFRKPEFTHSVSTPWGRSWSLVVTGPWKQEWYFNDCQGETQ